MGMQGWASSIDLAIQGNLRNIEGAKSVSEVIGAHYGIPAADAKKALMQTADRIYLREDPNARAAMEWSSFAQTDLVLDNKLDTIILQTEQESLKAILSESQTIRDVERETLAKIKTMNTKPTVYEGQSNIPKVKRKAEEKAPNRASYGAARARNFPSKGR